MKRGFASDNNSGVHPHIMQALQKVNEGHVVAYGNDPYTASAIAKFKAHFGEETEVLFVYNGTGANVLAISSATRSFDAVLCTHCAHIYEDECGSPEHITGCKLIPIPAADAKLTIDVLEPYVHWQGDEHRSQPRMVSLTQSTEYGTLYTVQEIKTICDWAHQHGMYVHMDGARISNASVALGVDFKTFTRDAGVDVLSFGGTKNGLMFGEAVLFFNPELVRWARFHRKNNSQLHSKMRYTAAQFEALLTNDLWKNNATHANAMAQKLAKAIADIPNVQLAHPVQANGVFAYIPPQIIAPLQAEFYFYMFDEHKNMARWMCSFDTTDEDVTRFAETLRKLCAAL